LACWPVNMLCLCMSESLSVSRNKKSFVSPVFVRNVVRLSSRRHKLWGILWGIDRTRQEMRLLKSKKKKRYSAKSLASTLCNTKSHLHLHKGKVTKCNEWQTNEPTPDQLLSHCQRHAFVYVVYVVYAVYIYIRIYIFINAGELTVHSMAKKFT